MIYLAAVLSVTTAVLSASAYWLCAKYPFSFDASLVPTFYLGSMAILAGQYLVLKRLNFSKLKATLGHLMLYDRFRMLRSWTIVLGIYATLVFLASFLGPLFEGTVAGRTFPEFLGFTTALLLMHVIMSGAFHFRRVMSLREDLQQAREAQRRGSRPEQ